MEGVGTPSSPGISGRTVILGKQYGDYFILEKLCYETWTLILKIVIVAEPTVPVAVPVPTPYLDHKKQLKKFL
jgi:hypothetical protein